MPSLAPEELTDWDTSSRREWLVTNGIGGYASASLSGANTRRYHGLLIPAFSPPLGRAVLVSKLEEEVRVEDQLYLLSANKYPSVIMPQGFRHLHAFSPHPVPTFTYIFHEGTVVLEKRIWMDHGRNTAHVRYSLIKSPEPIRLGLVPLLAYKDYHTEQHRWDGFHGTVSDDGTFKRFMAFDDANPLWFGVDAPFHFKPDAGWFFNFEHFREQERGLDFTEDLYCPGRFDGTLAPGQHVNFRCTVEQPETVIDSATALEQEMKRQQELLALCQCTDTDAAAPLVLAADQFVIPKTDRVPRATIIAGYPWFTDWGRDTMIALPGLCIATGRLDVARDILLSYANVVQDGLLPNRFTDAGSGAEYNTVDATLWYFQAIYEYQNAASPEQSLVQTVLPTLLEIMEAHEAGTRYGIRVDPEDGLLQAGEPGIQLTWMDAKVGDWVVTPRAGKAVEINALWYNAQRIMAQLCHDAGQADRAARFKAGAAKTQESFLSAFWNDGAGCLFDVIGLDGTPDAAVRPNQLFAVSLPHPVLTGKRAGQVVDVVQKTLLTPYGLRTLAPGSANYKDHYGPGDQGARDGAYHEGTVWPWLMGAYAAASLAVGRAPGDVQKELSVLVSDGLVRYGVGSIAEICDAAEPFQPNGCIAQAWSVGEVLRAILLTQGELC